MFHDEYSYEDICQNEKCFSSEDIEFGALLILSSIGAILVNHKKSRQRCYLQGYIPGSVLAYLRVHLPTKSAVFEE